jgi:hypothetical protein
LGAGRFEVGGGEGGGEEEDGEPHDSTIKANRPAVARRFGILSTAPSRPRLSPGLW